MNSYKQIKVLDQISENCSVIEVQKANKTYMMYQFENGQLSDVQKYNVDITKKISATHFSHMLSIIEEFDHDDNHYIVYESYEKDLLKIQLEQYNQVFTTPDALEYVARLFDNLDELHSQRFVYRNILPEKIYVKNYQPYFHDFSLCQFLKRKQRLFDLVGNGKYFAPEVFSEDGYGKQIDIWAVGVLLFYMLTKEYPFNFPQKSSAFEQQYKKQVQSLCKNGFDVEAAINKTKNPGKVKPNKYMQDFFNKIFQLDYTERITISQIKKHPLFQGYFQNQIHGSMLEEIAQFQNSSIFLSYAPKSQQSYQFHKEQVVLDFIQHSSQAIDLDCADIIDEQLRTKAKFAILKIGMIRLKHFQDIIYGLKKVDFKIDEGQWQKIRSSSYFQLIKQKIEKQRKIMEVYYKSALLQIPQKDQFYDLSIPQDFNSIKGHYRNIISSMFDAVKKAIIQNKGHRKLARKLTQTLVRLTIMHLINRIFDDDNLKQNFTLYFEWLNNKKNSLEDLDSWISDEKIVNLKVFMKQITSHYL